MNTEYELPECAHLYLVGDTQCRLCMAYVGGDALTETNAPVGTDDEGVDWGDMSPAAASAAGYDEEVLRPAPTYPDFSDNPHNHRFTISLAPDKPPFIVVRGNTASEITAAFQELESFGVYANLAAAWASLKAQGAIGQGLGPVTPVAPQAPAPGPVAGPYGTPPVAPGAVPQAAPPPFGPNVSVPNAPGYQGPPQQQWQQAPPASGGWNGGGGQQGGGRDPKPRPAGWAMVDVPYADKDRFKALRAQGTETGNYLRSKIQWGGKGTYWLDPSIAGWLAQQGFPVTQ